MSVLTINKQIQISAPIDQVFAAITDPDQIVQYYPIDSVISNYKVSGKLIIKGKVNGVAFTDYGVIEIFDPPHRFKYNYWSDNHGTENIPENRMTLDYALQLVDTAVVVNLTHANLLTNERKVLMNQVWDYLLSQLKKYVEKGRA